MKKQTAVALSSGEAEYYSGTYVGCQIAWLRQLLLELGFPCTKQTELFIDSNSAISMIHITDQVSNRTKHINIQYHWIHDALQHRLITTSRVDSDDNISDIFTKPLPRPKHEKYRDMLGMEMRWDTRWGGVLIFGTARILCTMGISISIWMLPPEYAPQSFIYMTEIRIISHSFFYLVLIITSVYSH